jgi:CIC family chloride channel protein
MVGVVLSNLLVYRLFGRSLFDVQLAKRGIDLSFGRDQVMLSHARVDTHMSQDYLTLHSSTGRDEIIDRMAKQQLSEAVVVDQQQQYLGMIRLRDAFQQATEATAADMIVANWPCFKTDTSIWQAFRSLGDFVGHMLPITDQQGQIKGVITEASLINAYLEIVHKLRREENEAV